MEKGDNLQRCPGIDWCDLTNPSWNPKKASDFWFRDICGKYQENRSGLVKFVNLARSQRYAVSKKLTWDPKKGSRNGSPNKTYGFSGAKLGKSISFRVGKTPKSRCGPILQVWGPEVRSINLLRSQNLSLIFPGFFFRIFVGSVLHISGTSFWCNRCTGNKFSFCFPSWCFQAFFYFHPEPWGFMIQFDELIFFQPSTSSLRGTRRWHGPSVGPSKEDSKPQESLWVAIPAAFGVGRVNFSWDVLP